MKPRSHPENDAFHHAPASAVRVLQLTDTHLFDDPARCLQGLNTNDSLNAVADAACREHNPADLILVTGDLTHDGNTPACERLREIFRRFDTTTCFLAGNHDRPELMRQYPQDGKLLCIDELDLGHWHIVLLDSTVPGEAHGHLSADTLSRLDRTLAACKTRHVLVCLHHNPVPTGSRWLDAMTVDNAAEFFSITDRHPNVKGILWGHIHQEYDNQRNGVRLLGSPSTCIQFKPGSDSFALEIIAPGYRWLVLYEDGRIGTGIARISEIPAGLEMTSSGY